MEQKERRQKVIRMLSNYKNNKVAIDMLKLDLQAVDALVRNSNMAVNYDQPAAGQTNRVISKTENEVLKMEQRRNEIHSQITLLQNQINKIDVALDNTTYPYHKLLELKYIEHKRWSEVYRALNYSEEYIRTKINEAALDMMVAYVFPEVYCTGLFDGYGL